MNNTKEIKERLNALGQKGKPFVFIMDFEGNDPLIFKPDDSKNILWQTPDTANYKGTIANKEIKKWEITPTPFHKYETGFNKILKHIHSGDTYLLNYTQPTIINTNLNMEELFHLSSSPYKIFLKNRFICFSPEIFVKIREGKISSYPMKGTIDATEKNAEKRILNDRKEIAEHNTIVDLIRNDLSLIATNVKVTKFRFLQRLKTSRRDLWQVSSEITGDLHEGYTEKIGDIIYSMLPAGSISGAPKKKTLEVIRAVENYTRGYYTGIFCYFDGKNLDSCVLIRYIENQNGKLVYKSGGGITFMSDAVKEYKERINKIYVPVH